MTGTPIKCCVCRDDVEEDTCERDAQMGGMVCPECKFRLIKSHVILKQYDISPAIGPKHINQWNFKRFQNGYHETQ